VSPITLTILVAFSLVPTGCASSSEERSVETRLTRVEERLRAIEEQLRSGSAAPLALSDLDRRVASLEARRSEAVAIPGVASEVPSPSRGAPDAALGPAQTDENGRPSPWVGFDTPERRDALAALGREYAAKVAALQEQYANATAPDRQRALEAMARWYDERVEALRRGPGGGAPAVP
jgi:hypothetical protein